MSNLKNFYSLNFFPNPLADNFKYPELDSEHYANQGWYLFYYQGIAHKKLISEQLFKWADKNYLEIEHCHMFAGPPRSYQDIHTDGPIDLNVFAINYVLSGYDSYMSWYNASDKFESLTTTAGHPFRRWQDSECREIERDSLRYPTLINASVPHRVVNNSNEIRWSLSLRFRHNFKSWFETVEFFKPYII